MRPSTSSTSIFSMLRSSSLNKGDNRSDYYLLYTQLNIIQNSIGKGLGLGLGRVGQGWGRFPIQFVIILVINTMQGEQFEAEALFSNLSEADPKQLRAVIQVLITKSRVLIHSLEETWQKLEQSEREKVFWKESYYGLRESCEKYVDSNGLAPFGYITALEDELRREKVTKSCLDEKYKVMHPQAIQESRKMEEEKDFSTAHKDPLHNDGVLESPHAAAVQNKHKIGPKKSTKYNNDY